MKKVLQMLTADDVRYILDDTLRETGLDQVPKRLDLLDKILTSVDKYSPLGWTSFAPFP